MSCSSHWNCFAALSMEALLQVKWLLNHSWMEHWYIGLATCKLANEVFLDGTLIEGLAISKLADETFLESLIRRLSTFRSADSFIQDGSNSVSESSS